MQAFLASIGYNSWVLPALLIIPVAGSVPLLMMGQRSGEATEDSNRTARLIAFSVLLLEFIVSIGLWWSFDPSSAG